MIGLVTTGVYMCTCDVDVENRFVELFDGGRGGEAQLAVWFGLDTTSLYRQRANILLARVFPFTIVAGSNATVVLSV